MVQLECRKGEQIAKSQNFYVPRTARKNSSERKHPVKSIKLHLVVPLVIISLTVVLSNRDHGTHLGEYVGDVGEYLGLFAPLGEVGEYVGLVGELS